jgi:REP element-mobilizing transposase RayT
MPRKSRIDAAGALHHIIARGIERGKIFKDNADRQNFLDRFGAIVKETDTRCYAWALIPNHFHLLLKTGQAPIATVMRRLLTGHAIYYNRRHRRYGHLFQNRYKSILCQEDTYLLQVVRYIHLNPLRARLVSSLEALDRSVYSGHSTIMGRRKNDWQDTGGVLGLFADRKSLARRRYRVFVKNGIAEGKREDLIGGGLLRSSGGWSAVKAMRAVKVFQKADERILGDGEFVKRVLAEAEDQLKRKYALQAAGVDLEQVAEKVCELLQLKSTELWSPGKQRRRVQARSLFCYWACRELGISMAALSRKLNISESAVSLSVKRGEKLAQESGYSLI